MCVFECCVECLFLVADCVLKDRRMTRDTEKLRRTGESPCVATPPYSYVVT